MEDLKINGEDAFEKWGVRMGDNFLDVLGELAPLKDFVENKSRLEHGKRVVYNNPKLDERDLTLVFTIEGSSEEDYQSRKSAFYNVLYKGTISIQVPDNGSEVYHLTYLGRNVSYAQNATRTFCKISAKFNEPNPSLRI